MAGLLFQLGGVPHPTGYYQEDLLLQPLSQWMPRDLPTPLFCHTLAHTSAHSRFFTCVPPTRGLATPKTTQ